MPPVGPSRPRRGSRAPLAAVVAATAVAVLAGGCAGAASETDQVPSRSSAPSSPGTAGLTKQDLDAWLDGRMPTALEETGIPGAAVAVVHDGELLSARGYGYADTGAGGDEPVPVDPERTLFRTGSVSKLFTATAVMQLVEEGEVDLDTDVHEYIDFTIPTSFDEPVTMRHLLSHTPGFEERVSGMILPQGTETDLRKRLATDPPEQVFEPGTVPAYSNYGNALAGYIVERVSGVPFEKYLQQNVLEPAGMDSSTFAQPLPDSLEGRLAGGYAADGTAPAGPFEVVSDVPAGALTAPATDMAQFMLAHLNDAGTGPSALLDPETLERMHEPALGEESLGNLAAGPRMALGFFREDRNGHRIVGHGGDTTYFHSHMQIYPDEDTGIFVSVNGGGQEAVDSLNLREQLTSGFADRYFPASDEQEADSSVEPTAAEHAAMAEGTYEDTRSMYSTFLYAANLMNPQTEVTAQEDGTILVTPGPSTFEPTVYEEIEPWVWREVGGQRILTMREQGGRVEAIGYGVAFTKLRLDPTRQASVALPVLGASVFLLVAAVVSWPVGAVARWRTSQPKRGRSGRVARTLTRVGVGGALAALGSWAVNILLVMQFVPVPDYVLYGTAAAQWLGVAAIAPAAVVVIDEIRRSSGWKRYLGSTLVLLALIGVASFSAAFGLLSFDMTY
ncbi:beta-lactamase [Streptomonospora alba]|uniref:Beta-lactamase n=1 Tax=Streptomonospora alba TaxID=183763 RepID=A0A0C2JLJ6_9ACTN|nr:beta-lactamase [Streptomonospora alba]